MQVGMCWTQLAKPPEIHLIRPIVMAKFHKISAAVRDWHSGYSAREQMSAYP